MVLELLVNPRKATGKPWEMFFIGAFYSAIAVLLSLWIFRAYASMVMITLTVMAAVPFVHKAIEIEEKKEIKEKHNLFKEHGKVISMFLFLFLGFVASFSILYMVLPAEVTQGAFSAQINTIADINQRVTGNYISEMGAFNMIIANNFKVLFFCIAFSFLYGAGAIFILTWNASVMAAAIGSFIRSNLFNAANAMGYFQITSIGLLRYLLHGVPEVVAYFVGALASGIISFAIIKHDFMDKNFKHLLKDAFGLIALSVIIILIAGLIEVFITPLIL